MWCYSGPTQKIGLGKFISKLILTLHTDRVNELYNVQFTVKLIEK